MKLDHIQLAMPRGEEEAARSFFVSILGMYETGKPNPLNQRGGVWFSKGGSIIHVGVEEDFKAQTKAHPAFLIDKLDALAEKLEDSNLPVQWDDTLPDRRRFFSTDPFGNRIEFISNGDGFSQKQTPQ